jgi:phage terminase large subunit
LAQKPKGSILDGIDLLDNLNVYYTKSSVNLAHEQENYSRKVDRYGIVLEEPEDKDNHLMDCVRYIATHLQSEGILIKV